MDLKNSFDGFDFDDQLVSDNEILLYPLSNFLPL